MDRILGKWVQKDDQPYPGLWFEFRSDGSFESQYVPMGIVSGGTYVVDGDRITIRQTEHTLGFIGEFKGLFMIEEQELKLALAPGPGKERPADLSEARNYIKHESKQ
jgi:hypothetical protein